MEETRALFLWSFSYGCNFSYKQTVRKWLFFFSLSFCFCSGFYRIQKVQIIYWAHLSAPLVFLPGESSFPTASPSSSQGRAWAEGERSTHLAPVCPGCCQTCPKKTNPHRSVSSRFHALNVQMMMIHVFVFVFDIAKVLWEIEITVIEEKKNKKLI